ncbi:hypothetical protein HPP92_026925 [Vanilla planifolia]|uniref:Uncharacterized protein n=1 Tax=Vanilla planifolia TaxID=51239 RepID=A0A835U5K3_VANPL|nr:hypothetical protein HPP92_026925 [Vanilla planifolia]
MRSAYDVISYVEFGKIIRKGKQRVKPILQAKYGVKFPRERRRTRGNENALAPPPPPTGNVTETSDDRHHRQEFS